MSTITTKDGDADLLQGLGPQERPADRLPPRLAAERRRLGHPDALSSSARATASSPMTGAATAARARSATATTWTTTPPTPPRSSSTSTCETPSTSATPPAAAKRLDTSPATAEGRVAKLVLIGAVPPIMVKTPANPGGLPDRGVRRLAAGTRRQPGAVLSRFRERSLLRLQPARREGQSPA